MQGLEIRNDCESRGEKVEPHPYRRTMVIGTIAMIIFVMVIGSASLSTKTSSILNNNNNNVLKNQALDNDHRRHLLDNQLLGDCGNCDGKVTSLTLKYHGAGGSSIEIVDKDNIVLYSDANLATDAEFMFIGLNDKTTMGTEITLSYGDGNECVIHTSCSQPMEIGLFFCDNNEFEVLDGASLNGGPFLSSDCLPDCDNCDGKVTDLTLKYHGPGGYSIEIVDKDNVVLYSESDLVTDAEFMFIGLNTKTTMGTEITLSYGDGNVCVIHTSCSKLMEIGLFFCDNDFEVLDGASLNGGPFLPLDSCLPECDTCDGKVTSLTLTYHGPDGFSITIVDEDDIVLYFDAALPTDTDFMFIGLNTKTTMGKKIMLSYGGEYECEIHTSCSQPMEIGLFFCDDDFEVVDGASKKGGPFRSSASCSPVSVCSASCDAPLEDVRVTDPTWWGPYGNMLEEDVPTAEDCCQRCFDAGDCELYQHSVGLQTCVLFSAPLVSTESVPLIKNFTVVSC
jgi:hypothetical protein